MLDSSQLTKSAGLRSSSIAGAMPQHQHLRGSLRLMSGLPASFAEECMVSEVADEPSVGEGPVELALLLCESLRRLFCHGIDLGDRREFLRALLEIGRTLDQAGRHGRICCRLCHPQERGCGFSGEIVETRHEVVTPSELRWNESRAGNPFRSFVKKTAASNWFQN